MLKKWRILAEIQLLAATLQTHTRITSANEKTEIYNHLNSFGQPRVSHDKICS
jgi:hypothetical protein